MKYKTCVQTLLILGLVFACCCILYKANWVYSGSYPSDDYQLLMTTARGKCAHGGTWGARFWPLGLSDYSILLLFGKYGQTPLAHYIWNCITLVFGTFLMFRTISQKTNVIVAVICLSLLFVSSGFTRIHMECTYAERMIVFIFSVFVFSVFRKEQTQNWYWYIPALVLSTYAIYMKELVFVVFFTAASTELLFGKLNRSDKVFYGLLLLNCLIFIAIYTYRRIFMPPPDNYYATIVSKISDLSLVQFINEPLLLIVCLLAATRGYFVLLKKERRFLFEDSLIFAAVAYTFGYFLLKLYDGYYVYPSLVLALPAIANFLNQSRSNLFFGILISCFCGHLNFESNKNIVRNIWKYRESDHKIFEYIVGKANNGWKVYWLSDNLTSEEDPIYYLKDRRLGFINTQHFLIHYNKKKKFQIELLENNILQVVNGQKIIIIINEMTFNRKNFQLSLRRLRKRSPQKVGQFGENRVLEIE